MAIFHQVGGISTSSIGNIFKNPLSSLLGGGKGSVLNLKFPEDLGSETSRMHAVQIEIYELLSPSSAKQKSQQVTNQDTSDLLFSKLSSSLDNAIKNTAEGLTDIAKTATESFKSSINSMVSSFANKPSEAIASLASKAREAYTTAVNVDVNSLTNQIAGITKEGANVFVDSLNKLGETAKGLEEFASQMGDTLTSQNLANNMKLIGEMINKADVKMTEATKNYISMLEKRADSMKSSEKADASGGATSSSGIVSSIYDKAKAVAKEGKDIVCGIQETIQNANVELKGKISLYMPSTLSVQYTSSWDESNLDEAELFGVSIGGAQTMLKGINVADEAMNNASKAWNEEYSKSSDVMKSAKSALSALGRQASEDNETQEVLLGVMKKVGNKQAYEALSAYFHKTLNPQTFLKFSTNGFRTIMLDFMMTPRNKSEADSIIGIVNALTYASTMSTKGQSAALTWPSFVQLKFLSPNTSSAQDVFGQLAKTISSVTGVPYINNILGLSVQNENERIFKFDKMVITDVNVDYAPNGWTAFDDGTPSSIRLTLGLKEYKLPTRERMREGIIR